MARFDNRERHPGHLDRVGNGDREQRTQYFRDHAELGPLGLGKLIRVNTSGDTDSLSEGIIHKIRNYWEIND